MKLLIFDDHRVITDAIASYAKANSDVEIIAQCHRIVEVKKAFDKNKMRLCLHKYGNRCQMDI